MRISPSAVRTSTSFDVAQQARSAGDGVRRTSYRGHTLTLDEGAGGPAFSIDGGVTVRPTVRTAADGSTRYWGNGLPYQDFGSLEEMAQAYARAFPR